MPDPGEWRAIPAPDGTTALVDPRGVEVLWHWYTPFVRRCAGRLGSAGRLNAERVRGICLGEAVGYARTVEFSAAYADDFDSPARKCQP